MRKQITFWVVLVAAVVVATSLYISHYGIPVFQPAGVIGQKEKNLLIFASILAVIVVVPTFVLTIFISLKYREGNKKPKKYKPDFDHNLMYESIWWGIPIIIIGILSVVAWNSAHTLDPYEKIASYQEPLDIQVVSLDWKWLFIYPDENVATVNYFNIPVDRPVHFYTTADAPMSSFWVPSLGGQMYAMPGMKTQLYEKATKIGSYSGSNANVTGAGFARMSFDYKVMSNHDYYSWIHQVKQSPRQLDIAEYNQLARHNVLKHQVNYSSVTTGLFDRILMQYMMPGMELKDMAEKPHNMPDMPQHKVKSPKLPGLPHCGDISPSNKEVFITC